MHAPIVVEITAAMPKKFGSERILRTRRSNVSKTESSGSSSDTPLEECESCGNVGNLVTCHGCFGAFHAACFNPSVATESEEDDETYCLDCTTLTTSSPGTSSPLSGTEVIEEIEIPSPRTRSKAQSEKASSPSKKKRKQPIKICELCDQTGELVACIICEKTFHTYCVDLVHPTPHFKCSHHEEVDLIPREMFPLHFTPEKWRGEAAVMQIEDDKDTTLGKASKKSRASSEDDDVPEILLALQSAQTSEILPSILKNFSPKFIEFLAWQQLRHIQRGMMERRDRDNDKF